MQVVITRDSEVMMFSPCVFVCVCVFVWLCLSRCLSGRFYYEGLVPHKWYFAGILLGIITRDSEVMMFSPCVFVCVCVSVCLCLSRCLSGRFNYEGLVPHKWYFAGILLGIITRDSEVMMFSPCVFVCVCVSVCLFLSWCLSGRFNYEGLVPRKWYFAGILLGMPSCASYVSRTHDVKMSEMLMAIFLVYSTSGINSGKKKFVASSKWRPFWSLLNITHSFNLTSDMERSSKIIPKKYFSWWRHRWRHRVTSKSALFFPL